MRDITGTDMFVDMRLEVVVLPVWYVQEITTRLPGRETSPLADFDSVAGLAAALRRAAAAHGKHEQETGQADPNWPDWYAQYLADEAAGRS